MSRDPHDPIQSAPGVDPEDRMDEDYSPSGERETEQLQEDQQGSPALADPDVDRDAVKVLPGTGDYTDDGDVDVDPGEVRMPHLDPGRTDDRPPA
ncbi:hypothetical protein [Amnibacterium endophyticum]|uniref:Sugar ABC transporter ATPase n=1 Tax=Amnibacterium endophyticum TaxID=2109337 RepID=A0ABW4LEU1_9MICO